jgi:hypothetical protein
MVMGYDGEGIADLSALTALRIGLKLDGRRAISISVKAKS